MDVRTRGLWILALLVLVAAGAAATLIAQQPAQAGPTSSQTTSTVTTAGGSTALDLSQLPRPTGWIVFPVHAEAEANVRTNVDVEVQASEERVVAATFLQATPDGTDGTPELSVAGDLDTAHRQLEANHEGRSAGCCASDDEARASFAAGSGTVLGPGETAYVGLVVVNASEAPRLSMDLEVLRQAEEDAVEVGEPRIGTSARAVDLVQAAQRAGTNARVGLTQVGQPGEADWRAEAERSTFGFLEADVHDEDQVEISLALPEGSPLEAGPGERGQAAALAPPGETRATLTGLEAEDPRDIVGSETASEARLVHADLPVPIHARDTSLHEPGDGRPDPVEVRIGDDELPADTGWFLAPIEAPEPTSVHLQLELSFDEAPEAPMAAVPIVADGHHLVAPLYGHGHQEQAHVSAAGHEASCCPWSVAGAPGGLVQSGFYAAGPEEPLYVGLLAANWSQEASLSFFAGAEDAELAVGPIETGTEVAFLDLFREASAQPSARVDDARLLGGFEEVHRSWSPERTELVSVAWQLEDARGDVRVELANGTRLSTAPSEGTEGRLVAADEGRLALSFEEADRSDPSAQALAVAADLPLPYQGENLAKRDA